MTLKWQPILRGGGLGRGHQTRPHSIFTMASSNTKIPSAKGKNATPTARDKADSPAAPAAKKTKSARKRSKRKLTDAPALQAEPRSPTPDPMLTQINAGIAELRKLQKEFQAFRDQNAQLEKTEKQNSRRDGASATPLPPSDEAKPASPPPPPTKPEASLPPEPTVEVVGVGALSPPVLTKLREGHVKVRRDPSIQHLADLQALRTFWARFYALEEGEIASIPRTDYCPAIRFEPDAIAGSEFGYTWVVSQDRSSVVWKHDGGRVQVSFCCYQDQPEDEAGPWTYYGEAPLMTHERLPTPGWEWCEHDYTSTWSQAMSSTEHFWNYIRPSVKVCLINTVVENKVRNRMSTSRTLSSASIVQQAVEAAYRELPEWKDITQLAPRAFEHTVQVTKERLLWKGISNLARDTEVRAAETGASLTRLRSAEDTLFNPRPEIHSSRWRYLLISLGLVALIWQFRQRASWKDSLVSFFRWLSRQASHIRDLVYRAWTKLRTMFTNMTHAICHAGRQGLRSFAEHLEAIREERAATIEQNAAGYRPDPNSSWVLRTVRVMQHDPFGTVIGPVIEEYIKRQAFHNPWAALFSIAMVVVEGPANLIKHAFFAALPLPLGIFFHMLNNIVALQSQPTALMVGWRTRQRVSVGEETTWNLVDVLHVRGSPIVVPGDNMGIEVYGQDMAIRPRMLALCDLKPLNTDMRVEWTPPDRAIEDAHVPREGYDPARNPVHYPLRFGTIPPWAPARCDWNLWYVVRTRLLTKQVLTNAEQRQVWSRVRPLPITPVLWAPVSIDDDAYEDFVQHMVPLKRRAYRRARLLNVEDPTLVERRLRKVQIMIKTDEVLFRPTLFGDHVALEHKPRAIANVHISVSAALGPWIYQATQEIKKQWSGFQAPVCRGMSRVVPVFASSFTDLDLTRVYHHAIENVLADPACVYIFVAGDDSLVVAATASGLTMYEGDFSQYDAAQMEGPLEVEYQMLSTLGVPEDVLRLLRQSNHAPWEVVFRNHPARLLIHRPPSRNTGGVDTTLGNSLLNAVMWAECFSRPRRQEDIVPFFAGLGFELKLKTMGPSGYPTFLKGMWYPVSDPAFPWGVWAPLPSRLLKLGKALKRPSDIYGRDPETSSRAFLRDNALGLGPFLPVPLLREFVAKWSPGPDIQARVQEENTAHKVAPSGVFREYRALAPEAVLSLRYGVPAEWFDEVAEMIHVQPMWSTLHHPLLIRLLGVDYAGW